MVECKAIAPKYGVTPKTIRDIWRGRTWIQATGHLWTEEERIQRAQDDSSSDDEEEGTEADRRPSPTRAPTRPSTSKGAPATSSRQDALRRPPSQPDAAPPPQWSPAAPAPLQPLAAHAQAQMQVQRLLVQQYQIQADQLHAQMHMHMQQQPQAQLLSLPPLRQPLAGLPVQPLAGPFDFGAAMFAGGGGVWGVAGPPGWSAHAASTAFTSPWQPTPAVSWPPPPGLAALSVGVGVGGIWGAPWSTAAAQRDLSPAPRAQQVPAGAHPARGSGDAPSESIRPAPALPHWWRQGI